jgi:hypothetical protein
VSILTLDSRTLLTVTRLEGPGIKIVVGREDASLSDRNKCRTWTLPEALLSHHSPYLSSECQRVAVDPLLSHISLADVDPGVFALFVEWMCKYTCSVSADKFLILNRRRSMGRVMQL